MAAGPIDDNMRWTARSADRIVVDYDDTYLVYFRPSGDTHFLNFLSYGVVAAVTDGAMTRGEIFRALRDRFGLEATDLPMQLVARTISELDDAGLIEPAAIAEERA